MISSDKIFGNLFDKEKITNLRLVNFAEDSITRFTTLAIEGQFATLISEMTVAMNNLRNEVGDVDTRLGTQKLKTARTNQFMQDFKKTMSNIEGMVTFLNGGKDSDLYHEMYPNGLGEYSKANKTKMPILMNRINDVVSRYGTQLNADIVTKLGTLKTQWQTIRIDQEKQMTKVDDSRADRSAARRQLEIVMNKAVRTIALEFLMDVEQCERFFNFRILTAAHHEEEEPATTEAG